MVMLSSHCLPGTSQNSISARASSRNVASASKHHCARVFISAMNSASSLPSGKPKSGLSSSSMGELRTEIELDAGFNGELPNVHCQIPERIGTVAVFVMQGLLAETASLRVNVVAVAAQALDTVS